MTNTSAFSAATASLTRVTCALPVFTEASSEEIREAVNLASEAFKEYSTISGIKKATYSKESGKNQFWGVLIPLSISAVTFLASTSSYDKYRNLDYSIKPSSFYALTTPVNHILS